MKYWTFSLLALLTAGGAQAQVTARDAWVRATVPQQKATGAFMRLESAQDARLVAARSPVAGVVEIHEMAMENQVMKMRAVPGLDLPAGKTVELKPGGYHVMLLDLKAPLAKDSTVPLTLVFQDAKGVESKLNLTVPVGISAPGGATAGSMMDGHKH